MIAGAGVLIVGTGLGIGASLADRERGDALTTPPATTPTGTVNVLTGKPGPAGRVLAVKIDNVSAARPATGLDKAAIVYAIQVEGGLSRLMAVYDSQSIPRVVGPVRSARESDLQILAQYNHPALAYSGARTAFLKVIAQAPVRNVSPAQEGGSFYRSSSRYAPHNEYLRTAGLAGEIAKDIGLRFGPVPAGGTADTSQTAKMPAARFTFQWNGSRYSISMDGDRQPAQADTVVLQDVRVGSSPRGYPGTPYSETVGSGDATVLRDGKRFEAEWKRPTPDAGTTFTYNGKILNFHAGTTWIVLV